MLYLSLFCFLLLGALIIFIVKNKYLRILLAIVFEFFFFLDLIAIFTKVTHINYAFIANIEKSIIKIIFTAYLKYVIFMIILIILFNYIGIKLLKRCEGKLSNIKYKYLILLLVVINFSKIGVMYSIYKTVNQTIFVSKNLSFKENLKDIGINPNEYILKDEIKAKSGKNVVIIYLESLEKNYLDNELFNNITPNLNNLKKEWSFYDYQDNSEWTMGAMYTTQTGLPPYFGINGNETFQNITKTSFPSIGSILKKAGYNQIFMNGASLAYAGKGNFFKQQEYECYGNEEYDKKYSRNAWGLTDKFLFMEAKKKYKELSDKREPFNLTILTVDAHANDGFPDESLKEIVKTKNLGMEYCIETTDYLVGDFINFLKEQENYKNLAIYILSDHKLMGNELVAPANKKLNMKSRDLFLLTNQKNILGYEDVTQKLYFYDIPRLILNGTEIKTNAKFLKDLIPNLSIEYIKRKRNEFQNLNMSLMSFDNLKGGIEIKKLKNGEIIVKSNNKILDKFYLNSEDLRYYSINKNLDVEGKFTVYKKSNNLRYYLDQTKNKMILGLSVNNKNELILECLDYAGNVYLKTNKKEGRNIIKIKNYSITKNEISISASELLKIYNFIELQQELLKLDNLNSYLEYLKKLNNEDILIIISSLDEASSLFNLYKDNIKNLGLNEKLLNSYRSSYLGVLNTRGDVFLEEMSLKKLEKYLKIDKMELNLESSGYSSGSYVSSIRINGVNYSKNRRGLNFVILDKKNSMILDSFYVDTCSDTNLNIRK